MWFTVLDVAEYHAEAVVLEMVVVQEEDSVTDKMKLIQC